MNPDLQALLTELRYHAKIYPRSQAVIPGWGKVKLAVGEALAAVAELGGHVEQSEVWVLPGGWLLLAPWRPVGGERP